MFVDCRDTAVLAAGTLKMAGDGKLSPRERPSGERLFLELMRVSAKLLGRGEDELAAILADVAVDALLLDCRLFLALDQVRSRDRSPIARGAICPEPKSKGRDGDL